MLRTLCAILIAGSISSAPAWSAVPISGENSVERRYCTQYGPFILRFDPEKAAGIFAILRNNDLGSIVGALNEHQLEGNWIEVDSHGQIRMSFTDDWSSFTAQYNVASNPDRWNGGWIGHIAPSPETTEFDVDDVTFYCH